MFDILAEVDDATGTATAVEKEDGNCAHLTVGFAFVCGTLHIGWAN